MPTANAGYRLFSTGDVLTAAQVQYNLQNQTIMYFANAAARTSALSGVLVEGMFSYLADTNATEYYDGSAWTAVGGGGGGGMTLISTTALSSTTTTISVSANSYKQLILVFRDLAQSGNTNLGIRINSISGASDYLNRISGSTNGSAFNYYSKNSFAVLNAAGVDGYGTNVVNGTIYFYDANSTKNKLIFATIAGKDSGGNWGNIMNTTAAVQDTAVISSISVCSFDSYTLSGSALLYGVS